MGKIGIFYLILFKMKTPMHLHNEPIIHQIYFPVVEIRTFFFGSPNIINQDNQYQYYFCLIALILFHFVLLVFPVGIVYLLENESKDTISPY